MSDLHASAIDGLSDEQRAPALCIDDPVLALAGAGSGKTRMLVGRFAHLIRPESEGGVGADPDSIMMVTFTNKAGREMRERVTPLIEDLRESEGGSGRLILDPWIGTFHGLSLRILRAEASKIGLRQNFSIFDESDAESVFKEVVEERGITRIDKDDFFRDLEYVKARQISPSFMRTREAQFTSGAMPGPLRQRWDETRKAIRTHNFGEIYEAYQTAVADQNAVDFNDLINHTTQLLRDNPSVSLSWRSKFRHFLVDEVQDLNRAQAAWLDAITGGMQAVDMDALPDQDEPGHEINRYRLRARPRPTFCCVGDDNQSIYKFRGSDVSVMRGLSSRFEGLRQMHLSTSYRCRPSVLEASNTLVSRNADRMSKDLVSPEGVAHGRPVSLIRKETPLEEIDMIAQEARAHIRGGGNPAEFAVLTRTRDQARRVAKGLRETGLPVTEGKSADLRKAAEIRDILAFASIVTNPDNETAFRRIINKPSRGLGPTSMARVTRNARMKDISFLEESRSIIRGRIDLPDEAEAYKPRFVEDMKSFGRLIVSLREAIQTAPTARDAIIEICGRTGYLDQLQEDALKSAGLSRSDVPETIPQDFLKSLFTQQAEGGETLSDIQDLAGEDLADRASRASTSARRVGNIGLLLDQAAGSPTLDDFIQDASLEMSETDNAPAGIGVMTIHASKGLEFDHVRLPFWADGVMPHAQALEDGDDGIEEERRLAYVAMTRARQTLGISQPSRDMANILRRRRLPPSRFLEEIRDLGPDSHVLAKNDAQRLALLGEGNAGSAIPGSRARTAPPRPRPAAGIGDAHPGVLSGTLGGIAGKRDRDPGIDTDPEPAPDPYDDVPF